MRARFLSIHLIAFVLLSAHSACNDSAAEAALPAGSPCQWGAQCEGGYCIGETLGDDPTGWTDGMCTEVCDNGECGPDGICTDLSDGRYCLPVCGNAKDCRSGYVCHSELGVCFPDCAVAACLDGYVCGKDGECDYDWKGEAPPGAECGLDEDCAEGLVCGASDLCAPPGAINAPCGKESDCAVGLLCGKEGKCEMGEVPHGSDPVGAPCTDSSTCSGGLCLTDQTPGGPPVTWTDGMCSAPCVPVGCPAGSGCIPNPAGGICLPQCTPGGMGRTSADCRSGYACDPGTKVCVPSCKLGWLCPQGTECKPIGVCGKPGGMQ